ncbi:MAG TPA: acyl-CoA dehydrogenase family protein, partial [Chitinophagales bacterium]|nr:acyl-CoA dehydrogenase family protein [Chitinophagales bacterium]
METATNKNTTLKGGEFVIRETSWEEVYIPEQITEEQQMVRNAAKDFIHNEIDPFLDRLDAQEEGLLVKKLDAAGELGLLGLAIPEQYGGSGLDFTSGSFVGEVFGGAHGFSVSMGAQTG